MELPSRRWAIVRVAPGGDGETLNIPASLLCRKLDKHTLLQSHAVLLTPRLRSPTLTAVGMLRVFMSTYCIYLLRRARDCSAVLPLSTGSVLPLQLTIRAPSILSCTSSCKPVFSPSKRPRSLTPLAASAQPAAVSNKLASLLCMFKESTSNECSQGAHTNAPTLPRVQVCCV